MEQHQSSSPHELTQQQAAKGTGPGAQPERDSTDISIIRESTPRPRRFTETKSMHTAQLELSGSGETTHNSPCHTANFPSNAPLAPPLPEEDDGTEMADSAESASARRGSSTLVPSPLPLSQDSTEFLWLFEYGLEMDSAFLNSVERLDGLALPYGTAYLKGYTLGIGYIDLGTGQTTATLATLLPASLADSKSSMGVWGMLFRIPRRLTERTDNDTPLLDTIHGAAPPLHLYRPVTVEVRETYRQRTVSCLAYLLSASAQQQFYALTPVQKDEDTFVRRLDTLARKLRLPESYLPSPSIASQLPRSERQAPLSWPPMPPFDSTIISESRSRPRSIPVSSTSTQAIQQAQVALSTASAANATSASSAASSVRQQRWLMVFACYLSLLLPITLTLIVLQSLGILNTLQVPSTSSGVPVLVLVYGLLGGCISSILTLRRVHNLQTPSFVLLTWFTRPYVGAVIALLAFLLLQSGLIAINGSLVRHGVLFLLVGILAGLCEGWLFVRR